MALDIRQEQVYELLLTPIECSKSFSAISRRDGTILSSQKYCYGEDCDMSDFAVEFYEILYCTLLSGKRVLSENRFFSDVELAGDTMNSFNTAANTILGDADAKHRSPKNKWPDELLLYHSRYRTLANYWLIPMRLGRTGTKLNKYDSIDLFLNKLERDFSHFQEEPYISYRDFRSENYFRRFTDYKEFCSVHFAERSLVAAELLTLYRTKEGCMRLVCEMSASIERRARCIAEDTVISAALWEWFHGMGFIERDAVPTEL